MFVHVLDRPVKRVIVGNCGERGVMVSAEKHISADLSIGSVFAGRYRVERRIASGGMGAVYEVVHLETNRRRALKVMHAHYVSSDELRTRFRQEARVTAEIESEHIVDVFDAGVDDATGMPFLVMELLRGEELGKHVKRMGPLPKEDVVRYVYETSLALEKTHRARIVHRDLKPDNLFLCEREHGPPRVKVLDFGIAKIVKDSETKANATRSLGTPLYMAPEQFQLRRAVTSATDIFALGMIAFTLLVGKPYWHAESSMADEVWAFAMHVATGPKESAVRRAWELFGVELPRAFDAWFFRITAPDPAARFSSAREAAITLAEALGVPSPASEFVKPNPSTTTPQTRSHVPERAALSSLFSASQSAPRTGPTMLAMTPDGDAAQTKRRKQRTPPWMLATIAGGLMAVGACTLLLIGLSGDQKTSASPTPQVATPANKSPSAATASISAAISTMSALPQPKVEPAPAEAPATTSTTMPTTTPSVESPDAAAMTTPTTIHPDKPPSSPAGGSPRPTNKVLPAKPKTKDPLPLWN